jgi:hypothetical protein
MSKGYFVLLTIAAFISSLAISAIVALYLVLAQPQGLVTVNWGIGAIVIVWIAWAIGSFFQAINE